jgi:hypothetical protein
MSQEEGDHLRRRFNVLARKAEAFFKEAGGESWNARRIADQNWALLSAEQKASADGIRRELRNTLSLLVPEIQVAPLRYPDSHPLLYPSSTYFQVLGSPL